jgi:cyclopropane fatty-acyl-phospholipid synthase-like methyltransferase
MTSSDALAAALEALRHQQAETGTLSLEMLAPLDQFHVRGLDAIVDLLAVCPFKREDRILDIGCGLGGPARFLAREIGCKVTATDIDGRAIETATQLNQLSGMTEHVTFRNCAHTDLETGRFDGAWSIHVSQFVADKVGFFSGIADQLTHGASLVLFDPVRTGGTYGYPVP